MCAEITELRSLRPHVVKCINNSFIIQTVCVSVYYLFNYSNQSYVEVLTVYSCKIIFFLLYQVVNHTLKYFSKTLTILSGKKTIN